jgi:ketosteroid isomerase-like protein
MKTIVVGFALLLCGSFLVSPTGLLADDKTRRDRDADSEQELKKLEHDWAAAVEKNDADVIARFLADDFVFIGPRGNLQERMPHLDDFRSGRLAIEAVKIEETRIRVYGDAAVVSSRFLIKGKFVGMDITGPYRFTDTWVKLHGRWLSVARQQTHITVP